MADTFEICLKDDSGEMIHLNVYPNGLLVGYSEINLGDGPEITGTAFGSFKRLTYPDVMLGGDINNDCALGLSLLPGKFNARLNVEELSGSATGVLFTCDIGAPGAIIPFASGIVPCDDDEVPAANWRKFFEEDREDD